jgi:sugar lactone lactonase YvrE
MSNIYSRRVIYKSVLLLAVLAAGYTGNAQKITTIAGTGVAGYNGDEGTATGIELWSPAGVAVSGGAVYVADGLNNRIRKISPAGTITTIAGIDDPGNAGDGGPATDAQLNDPTGIAVDNHGNLYIADKYNNRIRKVTPQGMISAFAGTGVQGFGGNGGTATAALLNAPAGLMADSAGNIFIADAGNNCIREVTTAGIILNFAGNGTPGFSGDGRAATAAQLYLPNGMAIDTAGNIYIADSWNYRVRKVTPAGIITTIAGTGIAGYAGDGAIDTAAQLNLPTGIAADRAGNIYIADQGNNRIRRILPGGIMTTLAGTGNAGYSGDGGAAAIADLNAPPAIAVDAGYNLYIAEQQNNRIRRVAIPQAPKVVKTANKPDSSKAIGGGSLPPIGPSSGGYQFQSRFPSSGASSVPNTPVQPPAYNRRKNG